MNGDQQDKDPVEELHRIRDQLWRDAGGSWDHLFTGVRQRDAENKEHARIIPAPPPRPKDGRQGDVA